MKRQSGQALVLVLLSMSVVLTLVLYILSRSVTDIAVTSSQEEAVRAFSAAEAGIERALVIGSGTGDVELGNASSYNAQVTQLAEGLRTYAYPITMGSNDTATIWFVDHDTSGNTICDATHNCFTGTQMKVCWGKSGTPGASATTPAIEVSIFYEPAAGNPTTMRIARAAYDPYGVRRGSNSFDAPDNGTCTIDGTVYAFHKTFTFASLGIPGSSYNNDGGLQYARIRMMYNTGAGQSMGLDFTGGGNSVLPSQGQSIVSTGVSGESNRRVEYFQGWPEVPTPLQFAVYSSTSLTR